MKEMLIKIYLTGVSVRRVKDITETLRECRVSQAAISELNNKPYVHTEDWRNRPLQSGRCVRDCLQRNQSGEYEKCCDSSGNCGK